MSNLFDTFEAERWKQVAVRDMKDELKFKFKQQKSRMNESSLDYNLINNNLSPVQVDRDVKELQKHKQRASKLYSLDCTFDPIKGVDLK